MILKVGTFFRDFLSSNPQAKKYKALLEANDEFLADLTAQLFEKKLQIEEHEDRASGILLDEIIRALNDEMAKWDKRYVPSSCSSTFPVDLNWYAHL